METTLGRARHRIMRSFSELPQNQNTWFLRESGTGFWYAYVGSLGVIWVLLGGVVGFGLAGTWLHLGHAAVTMWLLHWMKGSPLEGDAHNIYDGDYSAQTFWEQIDDGKQYTNTRKAFSAVAVALYLLATNSIALSEQPAPLNLAAFFAIMLAKMPFMHGVRILGVNSGRRTN